MGAVEVVAWRAWWWVEPGAEVLCARPAGGLVGSPAAGWTLSTIRREADAIKA
jgi:hypothetical protein